jgi:hypothetical protein
MPHQATSETQVWVDSDGRVAYNGPRAAGLTDPRTSNPTAETATASVLLDRQWHMLTVTTQLNGTKGYRFGACADSHSPADHITRCHMPCLRSDMRVRQCDGSLIQAIGRQYHRCHAKT